MAKPRIQIEKLKHYESFVWLDFRKFDKSDKKCNANMCSSSQGSRCGTLERERRMLSMLGLGSGSNTTSSVTSPVTSPVPLGGGYDESYTMMSPTAGDPHGGLTVITSHSRTASLTSKLHPFQAI